MEIQLFTQATVLAATVVLTLTQLLKVVPVKFTSKYPAWVNAILSVVAAIIVIAPTATFEDLASTLGTALLIAVTAALAYNQFVSKLVGESNTSQG